MGAREPFLNRTSRSSLIM